MDSRLRGNDGLDYRSLTRMGSLTRMRVGDTFGALGLNEGRCQDGCRAEDSQLHGAGLLDPEDVRGGGRAQGEIRSGQRLRPVAWQSGGRASTAVRSRVAAAPGQRDARAAPVYAECRVSRDQGGRGRAAGGRDEPALHREQRDHDVRRRRGAQHRDEDPARPGRRGGHLRALLRGVRVLCGQPRRVMPGSAP